ncbi:hypothetical protein [Rhodanobacter denitrificans]|uniref:Uncharacterized protein n=1 Tax=Rhodanobacter denitrificans TaxID=666685 RepID=M4NGC0_9GAMM|nr:hypothetical protein [Rhodanobacter denitrificans]AGG89944.1 hypothetical protein R2APBS1_2867 [Rhodanobacter denitrificans]UJM85339.1 hypothetical protein LRJ86_11165 [Rhodanobacter denitrificans]
MSTVDHRINALQPGQSIRISGDAACWCTVERSGNGLQLRWVRHTPKGFKVFHRERC